MKIDRRKALKLIAWGAASTAILPHLTCTDDKPITTTNPELISEKVDLNRIKGKIEIFFDLNLKGGRLSSSNKLLAKGYSLSDISDIGEHTAYDWCIVVTDYKIKDFYYMSPL